MKKSVFFISVMVSFLLGAATNYGICSWYSAKPVAQDKVDPVEKHIKENSQEQQEITEAYTWYMNRPDPRGYMHSLETVPKSQRSLAVEQCRAVAHTDAILGKVVDAHDLVSKFGSVDRQHAINVLREKTTVELSGDKEGIIFMVKGLRKDKAFTEKVAKSFYMETLGAMQPK